MQRLPKALQEVVDHFASLPGLGPKSGLRIALTLLNMPTERAREMGNSIIRLREALCVCERCGLLADESPCAICRENSRGEEQVCLVPDWDSFLAIEEAGLFRGKYLALGGLLSPTEGVQSSNLELERLRSRLSEGGVREIILALGSTRDGEATESFIRNMIDREFPHIRVSRLAQGIPVGSDLKYVDKETLKQSLQHRQPLE
ncbi:MAG: recombination mediator RecR [Desulfohalobiaceae bacterium]|nr:recombination mediator RecR [Desulfohalobiaceae bacterium]